MGRKRNDRRGFTLIEVLAVVAIIVVLIAIAIPSFMSAINHTRHEADADYERAAMALATAMLETGKVKEMAEYVFNPDSGTLITRADGSFKIEDHVSQPYGQCRKEGHTGKYLLLKVDNADRSVLMTWGTKFGGTGGTAYIDNLCDP